MVDKQWPSRQSWTMKSEFGREQPVVRELTLMLRKAGVSEERLAEIATAVSEACLNAIEHGNRGLPREPVRVELTANVSSCTVAVCDRGEGLPPDVPARPDSSVRDKMTWAEPRGWGLQLIRHYADDMRTFRRGGEFCVELMFRIVGQREEE